MGEALFKGFLDAGILEPDQIILSDVNMERLESLKAKYSLDITTNSPEAVKNSDVVLLAIKPQQIEQVLNDLEGVITKDKLVISIAAGVTTSKIHDLIGEEVPVMRVMPNTPALVGKGMSVISRGKFATDESVEITRRLFASVGAVVEVPENIQNQATAVSGSGPAYFFLMAEALIDAGVKAGLEKSVASELVIQTIAGAAALLQNTGKSPGELREMVTSPGGTTAAALQVFSEREFRYIVQEAVNAAIKRAEELA